MNKTFEQQIQESVEAGKKCFGTPEPKLGMLPTKGSKPFNWNVSDCIDFKLKLEFTKSFNSALEEIRRDKVELSKWRMVATQVAPERGDVSTPEKFFKLVVEALAVRMNQLSALQQQLEKERAARVEAFLQCEALTKVLMTVDKGTEEAWNQWLFQRDQVVSWKPTCPVV